MANRYWVGNDVSHQFHWTDTAHWSDTSGGVGGFSVPTSSDDVYFDSNSGSFNVDYGLEGGECNNFDSSSCSNNLRISSITAHGNMTNGAGIVNTAYVYKNLVASANAGIKYV